ncbi:membrane-bound lytic murein transglycosylase MltF [Sphingopyxis panaciterrae]|uniref:hypothetical protein n=1 Tax=Sphingopyxis panaciterrae TaxID=363841 RepID=UPI00142083FD|nr:hypothetical protein [Sphingopyxis panaciterrae]NIJ36356.1 membrane-bound lytic murein transglycosylase MltF [Sphingopyxis panaciterrae]
MARVKAAPREGAKVPITKPRPKGMILLALIALGLGGCDYFPRDPEHSLDDIRSRGILRIGAQQDLPPEATQLIERIERSTGAKAKLSEGALEPLLQKLDKGEIDLVIAPFTKKTPWAATSTLSPPIRIEGHEKNRIEWRVAMRSGENRWIFLVETKARQIVRESDAT